MFKGRSRVSPRDFDGPLATRTTLSGLNKIPWCFRAFGAGVASKFTQGLRPFDQDQGRLWAAFCRGFAA